ncbi:MAG: hypothetical protein GY873_10450 [Bosea sp.]|uniref:hypothetical protein n=1 Tax=Bosea sp. (in: a-proteobacteria) TaxID=1871050 RepID=UPI00238C9CFA|nr:hypothetical protein [Bosea sp. (in: a-proteobacteria)]MCP4734600.1 hypothetical protein [Bosea sp. (in: a-proteobacteria)]
MQISASRIGFAAVALLVAASPAHAQTPDLLACSGPFARDADEAALIKAFGAANVQRARIEIGEGEKAAGAILFPKDRKRRLELIWRDGKKRRGPSTIYVREGSAWAVAGPAGERLAIGSALAAVETANGKPFSILGFDWDYSGTAADWQGGKLAKAFGGCKLTIRFGYPEGADAKALDRLSGDKEFSSANPDMRLVKPTAYEILLSWSD